MKSYVIFLFFLFVFSARLAGQHTLPVTILPSAQTGSPGVMSLNGTWKFMMLPSLQSAIPDGWIKSEFNDLDWNEIHVPGNWEPQGFKQPEYGHDLTACMGLYRTHFSIPSDWKKQRVVLRFDGVHMGYECWVNGQFAGDYGSGSNPCNFDITPFLQTGNNTLCVKVTTRSFAWKFDTMDNWTFCGINRDVTLFTLPHQYIEDITFISENCMDNEADIQVRVQTQGNIDKAILRLSVQDENGQRISDFEQTVSENGICKIKKHLTNIRLWTAETPVLYILEACLCNTKGDILHRISRRVGLREVKSVGREITLNGKPIRLRGVCASEVHPYLGSAYTMEEWQKQLLQMKKAHINFIRTAHYPMHPAFYDLCDEMGFYVCNEIPLASRGGEYLVDSKYNKEIEERTATTIARDKNHPSVIIWSLGNENKTVAGSVATLVKEIDPTRLRGFPQTIGVMMKMMENPHPDINVLMGHYLNEKQLDIVAQKATLPFLQTEYAHSLGLGFGEFEQKWERILDTPGFAGGAIWCWMDGAAVTKAPKYSWLKGIMLDSLHYLDSYGYINPPGALERNKEANDGIIYAEGTPQEDYWLVRKLYSPVQIMEDTLQYPLQLTIQNNYDFRTLKGYSLHWSLQNLNRQVASGSISLEALPKAKERFEIPSNLPPNILYNDVMLCVSVIDEKGTSIYERALPVNLGRKEYKQIILSAIPDKQMTVTVTSKGDLVIKDKKNDNVLMQSPFYLRVGREFSQVLESRTSSNMFCWEPYILKPEIKSYKVHNTAEGRETKLNCQWNRVDSIGQYISGEVTILVHNNGVIAIDYILTASPKARGKLTECGLTLMMSPQNNTFHWLGQGIYSSVPGKTKHNERGIWSLHKDDYRFSGNRSHVELSLLSSSDETGIIVWDELGNIGVDKMHGNIILSQNVHVAGYGSKFINPCQMLPLQDLHGQKGRILLLPRSKNDLQHSAAKIFYKDGTLPLRVPDRPFLKGYSW